ncbi:tyrosine-type recombinase/integrase [Catenovulum sp. SM1970]|uniref:integrase domain-containing protein n=1 Tax=Marinifaba aquimaris TaxID=2741323 RepID=UPI00157280E7|nr:integrase domain-containing protein [Marinifaba aquimaris]NTS75697.1 tyrosine-type recombinase/integrase [Marinifaba aquimaris]
MPKTVTPLNDQQVKNAKAGDKEYNLSDGGGLALKVKPNGSKLWIFTYQRPFTKKRANLSFGVYPDVTLAKARKRRTDARALLVDDIDPQAHRDEHQQTEKQKLANSLKTVAEKWFAIKQTEIKEKTARDIKRILKLHVYPQLADVPISKLTAPLVIDVIQPVANKGNFETVKRICQRLNNIMVYALNTGIITHNPLSGISHAFEAPKVESMPSIKPDELPQFMDDLKYASIKPLTRLLIEFQLHTMTRPNEAAKAKWSEIDFDNKLWVIPAERMKMKREHVIPLSEAVLALLERIKPMSSHRDYIFPSYNEPRKPVNESTANMALKRMGYKNRLVAHGLRSLASTTLNEQGFEPDVIEAALAHVDKNEVRRAYNRADYLERRRVMMEWWSNHILAMPNSNIHPIKRVI